MQLIVCRLSDDQRFAVTLEFPMSKDNFREIIAPVISGEFAIDEIVEDEDDKVPE